MVDKKIQARDPFYQREAEKYPNPVPSREFIMQYLEEMGRPLSQQQLIDDFGIEDPDELDAFLYRLKAMLRDAQLMRDRRLRYCLIDKIELIPGVVIGHPDGHGFVKPDRGGKDFFLSPKQMRQVMHGDRVLMRQVGEDHRGRPEGAIFEVIERCTQQIVGRFFNEQGVSFVEPDNKRFCQDIHIIPEHDAGAKNGQYVLVEITQQPSLRAHALGKVVSIIGEHMAPGMEIDVAIHSHGLPNQWSEGSRQASCKLEQYKIEKDKSGKRIDLRHLPLVTIDGEDARDFDDAVYAEPNVKEGGWRLYVAIADVSHYVEKNAPLDVDALERGNSVYFPERVIPMLPEVLSNELCSLKPNVDRFCMVCEMQVTSSGKVSKFEFYPAIMFSQARLTYTQVAAMLEPGEDEKATQLQQALLNEYGAVFPHLQVLNGLFNALFKERQRRGAIEFDSQDTRIIFSEDKKIESIILTQRNVAHRIIEECMLAANVSAATFLTQYKMPTLYRVHESPDPIKLESLREFLGEFGLNLAGGEEPTAKDFGKVLTQLNGRKEASLIQTVMLRSLQQARYDTENLGHFGLAYEAYAHFTSPIRRYPDLLVHRAIRHIYEGGRADNFEYSLEEMSKLGEHCSFTERRADEATRDVNDWLKCEFMLDRIGEEFSGIITSVTNFGLFVRLDNVFVEGLVHITALDSDYYHFDALKHCLIGERTRKQYRLGDSLNVQVMRVDLADRKIDFELVKGVPDRLQGTAERSRSAAGSRAAGSRAASLGKKMDTASGATTQSGTKNKKNNKSSSSERAQTKRSLRGADSEDEKSARVRSHASKKRADQQDVMSEKKNAAKIQTGKGRVDNTKNSDESMTAEKPKRQRRRRSKTVNEQGGEVEQGRQTVQGKTAAKTGKAVKSGSAASAASAGSVGSTRSSVQSRNTATSQTSDRNAKSKVKNNKTSSGADNRKVNAASNTNTRNTKNPNSTKTTKTSKSSSSSQPSNRGKKTKKSEDSGVKNFIKAVWKGVFG